MKTKTNVKPGRRMQDEELLERSKGLKVRTHIRAGRMAGNHNETLARSKGLKLRTHIRAGRLVGNHNETMLRRSV